MILNKGTILVYVPPSFFLRLSVFFVLWIGLPAYYTVPLITCTLYEGRLK